MVDLQIKPDDMLKAIQERQYPAITRWNRLEGRPRKHDFDRALKADVRDALWMLAKQWQMGEFQGDDAGSPVLARACIDVLAIDRFQAAQGTAERLSLEEPLEAKVERRPLLLRAGDQFLSLDLRLTVGRRWMKLLKSEFDNGRLPDYRDKYLNLYQVKAPDPTSPADVAVCAHPGVWQQVSAVAERCMDGIALLEHLDEPGGQAYDGIGASAEDEPKLAGLADRLRAWFTGLIYQPATPRSGSGDAWLPERLEYQFGVSAQNGSPGDENHGRELVMRAEEYHYGHLDWYALERLSRQIILGAPPQPFVAPRRLVHTFLPAPVVFQGMPSTRWWAFEDRRTNFGEFKPDSTDLGKLLLMEFALVYANDWFVLPYTLPVGSVAEVKGIAISNTFDERFWIEPVSQAPAGDWSSWRMFQLSESDDNLQPAMHLVLLPTTPKIQESVAIEEVALIRDEMANMVWGVENRILLPSGSARPGGEAAREYLQHLQYLDGPQPLPPDSEPPPIRYQVMNTVPEHWIPFIPVHVDSSEDEIQVREIKLQRAALPRVLPNAAVPVKIRPRTSLLRQNLPKAYFIYEEEVPRAGAVVKQSYQRTRWLDGKVFTWLGVRKGTGRGEGSSGLRFDSIIHTKK